MSAPEPVAIVSAAGLFPGGHHDNEYWSLIAQARSMARPVRADRWALDPSSIVDPTPGRADRVVTANVCALDHLPDSRLAKRVIGAADPLLGLLLALGERAVPAEKEGIDRSRMGLIVGSIALPTASASEFAWNALAEDYPERSGQRTSFDHSNASKRLRSPTVRWGIGDGSAPSAASAPLHGGCSIPAWATGQLAKALGLGGRVLSLDAACASSLYAIALAIEELRAGRADAMLAGGVSRADSLYTQMGFSQLRALSPSGRSAPFDRRADGLIVGEGGGLFLLKRLSDAVSSGDPILGVIAAVGLSNDRGGRLLAPSAEGQGRALAQAYRISGWRPWEVELIECHATGAAVGDAVEFRSLVDLWSGAPAERRAMLGSVKGNIGHLLTGAGSAGLMKALLAMREGVLPPTAWFEQPSDAIDLAASPFSILSTAREWPRSKTPRRSAINAFGFGGVNGHLLVEEWREDARGWAPPASEVDPSSTPAAREPLVITGAAIRRPGVEDRAAVIRVLLTEGDDGSDLDRRCYEEMAVRKDRFKIPPRELESALPQQLLLLDAALDAVASANTGALDPSRGAVVVGITLDPRTTNYHTRWNVPAALKRWQEEGRLTSEPSSEWIARAMDAGSAALTADRTMGALASIAASRIARELGIAGPAFVVASDETSGLAALETVANLLERGDADWAIVGAVDFTNDPRVVRWNATDVDEPTPRADGAAALVIERSGPSTHQPRRVKAVIKGQGLARGADSLARALENAGASDDRVDLIVVDADPDEPGQRALSADQRRTVHLARETMGWAGAASGIMAFASALGYLSEKILPGDGVDRSSRAWLTPKGTARRAAIVSRGSDGTARAVVLEEDVSCEVEAQRTVWEEKTGAANERRPFALERFLENPILTESLLGALFELRGETREDWRQEWSTLTRWSNEQDSVAISELSARWRGRKSGTYARPGVVLLPRDRAELAQQLEWVNRWLNEDVLRRLPDRSAPGRSALSRVFFAPEPLATIGSLAFVYPGSGNAYSGMGRELALGFPEILRRQSAEVADLSDQLHTEQFWRRTLAPEAGTAAVQIEAQVAFGILATDVLRTLGVTPTSAIGYSLGESAALLSLGAWPDRSGLHRSLRASDLFTTRLAGPCASAREALKLDPSEPFEWLAGIVDCGGDEVLAKQVGDRTFLLARHHSRESLIGGESRAIRELVERLNARFVPLQGISTVHCPLARPAADEYRRLHSQTTTATDVHFYSCAWGKAYEVTRENVSDALTAQALSTIDYPALIEQAYEDGARTFIEIGPGGSCARWIRRILGDRPHLALAPFSGPAEWDGLATTLAALRAEGHLPEFQSSAVRSVAEKDRRALDEMIVVSLAPKEWNPPPIESESGETFRDRPAPVDVPSMSSIGPRLDQPMRADEWTARSEPQRAPLAGLAINSESINSDLIEDDSRMALVQQVARTASAVNNAHEQFLETSRLIENALWNSICRQFDSASSSLTTDLPEFGPVAGSFANQSLAGDFGSSRLIPPTSTSHDDPSPFSLEEERRELEHQAIPSDEPPTSLDYAACMEFAIGSIGKVLGPSFAAIDSFPSRVRLPNEPLMLVHRIESIEGTPRSLSSGRVITLHDVDANAWYLDGDRMPTALAVEAGQADLFLSGYLGIDFETKGLANYRLLDAIVTFHRGLPAPGETIRYDIRIDEFFQQSSTRLFRFRFDATIGGEPLMTMREGCAGFFSARELASGRGVVRTSLDRRPAAGKREGTAFDLVPMATGSLDKRAMTALRAGDLVGGFGDDFAGLGLSRAFTLPSGRLGLLDRVTHFDARGGRFGLGMIRSEMEIEPDAWFLTCHFVDDQVMPGTLMYECCLHTLRIFLLRMGWVGEAGSVRAEPIAGVASRLKCRGQVTASTRFAAYEVEIKELGDEPAPYAVADALLFADGKPIVEIVNLCLQFNGLSREELIRRWGARRRLGSPTPAPIADAVDRTRADSPDPEATAKPMSLTGEQVLSFAVGRPSDCFGEHFRAFDNERFIARLPGPPYQFISRVPRIDGVLGTMHAGDRVIAEYDVPADAWFFRDERSPSMPLAILLEIALQPCGLLAAFGGAAFTSAEDLLFRNLGGSARRLAPVTRNSGTLTMKATLTKFSRSGGMIIQYFDFEVSRGRQTVYEGNTYFGFFTRGALAHQVGVKDVAIEPPPSAGADDAVRLSFPAEVPFPTGMMKMLDDVIVRDAGGPARLGQGWGRASVDPGAWFFKAHFHQDPVWPGSLGLESMLQTLKALAARRWPTRPGDWFDSVPFDINHEWTYRGQIVPGRCREVTVSANVVERDDHRRLLSADGLLAVDGRVIYQMKNFSLQLCSAES